MSRCSLVLGSLFVASFSAPILAETVHVEVQAVITSNYGTPGPLQDVGVGGAVTMRFAVDSTDFETVPEAPLRRGYPIDPSSFAVTVDGVEVDMHPDAPVQYLVLEHDPNALYNSMRLSEYVAYWPHDLPTDQIGHVGFPIELRHFVLFGEDRMSSSDVTDLVGAYDESDLFAGHVIFIDFFAQIVTCEVLSITVDTERCAADVNADGTIGPADLAAVLSAWGGTCLGDCPMDVNADGLIGPEDLAQVLDAWGECE